MSLIRENVKNRGKVYRCFAIYNCSRQEFTHVQKRRCNKSYESSYQDVKEQAEKCFSTLSKQLNYKNAYSEWLGILDQHQKCFFMFMLFPQSNIQLVDDALNQIIKLVSTIPNYYHVICQYKQLTSEQLDQLKRTEIRKLIDKLENEYIENEGIMGNPSDDEQAGSKIITFNSFKSNPQSSFRSNIQQQPSKNDTRDLAQTKTTDREYIEFGVYRGFAIYSVKLDKIIFQLRRGSKQAFTQSINNIEKLLKSKSKQPQQNSLFIEQVNSRAEWHGKYHKPDYSIECYYLIMTFQNADPEQCNSTLKLAISRFSKDPNFVQYSLQELNDKYLWDISNMLKSSEKHYEYDQGHLELPSDDEIIPKLDKLKQSTVGITKNYSSFSASKMELIQMQILPRSQLIQLGETELDSPIQTQETILTKLNHFEPKVDDTEDILQYGVIISLVILLIISIYLILQ
ncbi:unnamed protein product (macronuclear) [Paramecium tetraurelia]|uniref:Uncharacterized protein n=1 Tax=Paramecium tetraurelia TaxID=5888 RepID=A0CB07_PARTE|nr:uncharacterized protein GSPATT00036757001 [Paramecium tetraurelia]CAK67974.1 unnamed protein product [Paramecium tetraurelia]|eukprot:XP_001435371.1 hypothetical protein (macronuclear) [Paramecium tetraurelia strain d4-2]